MINLICYKISKRQKVIVVSIKFCTPFDSSMDSSLDQWLIRFLQTHYPSYLYPFVGGGEGSENWFPPYQSHPYMSPPCYFIPPFKNCLPLRPRSKIHQPSPPFSLALLVFSPPLLSQHPTMYIMWLTFDLPVTPTPFTSCYLDCYPHSPPHHFSASPLRISLPFHQTCRSTSS